METEENSINLLDLSTEVLLIIAEACLNTPTSLAALAETCSSMNAVIYQQKTFWKRNLRRIFNVDITQWNLECEDCVATFTNLWRFKYQPNFFKFEPYAISMPENLSPKVLERSGHTAFLAGKNRILVVGGAGRAWHQHHDVLEIQLDDSTQSATVNQIIAGGDQQVPWIAWAYYDAEGQRIFAGTGDISEVNVFGIGRGNNLYAKSTFDLKNRAEVGCITGAGHIVLEETNELLLFGGRYASVQDPISTVYKLKFTPGNACIESEVIYPHQDHQTESSHIPRQWFRSQPNFDPRWCPAAIRLDVDRILVFGGWLDMDRTFLNDVKIFSLSKRDFSNVECTGDIPPPRCQVGSFLVHEGRYLVIYGGAYRKPRKSENEDQVEAYGDIVRDVDDIYVLDTTLWHWVRAAAVGEISSVHTCTKVADDKIIVIGGMHSDPGSEVPRFHNSIMRWSIGKLKKFSTNHK